MCWPSFHNWLKFIFNQIDVLYVEPHLIQGMNIMKNRTRVMLYTSDTQPIYPKRNEKFVHMIICKCNAIHALPKNAILLAQEA